MICIICEKKLESIFTDEISYINQPDGGGEIRVNFGYGSRYDRLCYRCNDPLKKRVKIGEFLSDPSPKALKDEDRTVRLAACSHVLGVICDDCFEKKSHLFLGYEEKEIKSEMELLVG